MVIIVITSLWIGILWSMANFGMAASEHNNHSDIHFTDFTSKGKRYKKKVDRAK